MPNLQVLLICLLGAFLATDYCTLFPAHARTSLNKVVFFYYFSISICYLFQISHLFFKLEFSVSIGFLPRKIYTFFTKKIFV